MAKETKGEINLNGKRGKQELMYAILNNLKNEPQKITHLLNATNCNYATYKQIKIKMLDKNLIKTIDAPDKDQRTRQLIQITDEGKAYLKLLSQVA